MEYSLAPTRPDNHPVHCSEFFPECSWQFYCIFGFPVGLWITGTGDMFKSISLCKFFKLLCLEQRTIVDCQLLWYSISCKVNFYFLDDLSVIFSGEKLLLPLQFRQVFPNAGHSSFFSLCCFLQYLHFMSMVSFFLKVFCFLFSVFMAIFCC